MVTFIYLRSPLSSSSLMMLWSRNKDLTTPAAGQLPTTSGDCLSSREPASSRPQPPPGTACAQWCWMWEHESWVFELLLGAAPKGHPILRIPHKVGWASVQTTLVSCLPLSIAAFPPPFQEHFLIKFSRADLHYRAFPICTTVKCVFGESLGISPSAMWTPDPVQ